MSSIKEHLDKILGETNELSVDGHTTEPDEFTAVKDIEIAVCEARKVFERTKNINEQ